MHDTRIITGPTGSGKTAVALEIAERIGAEIIALDSMTLYRGLDIGTAKPTRQEQARVPHHLIDVLDPRESADVSWWLRHAKLAAAEIRSRGRVPMYVGGTPFYLKALLEGLFDAPPVDPSLRAELQHEAAEIGPEAFHAKLEAIDPVTAARLHPNDVRRVVRALEIYTLTGRPISEQQRSWSTETFRNDASSEPIPAVMLDWPREELYRRIDARVLAMIDAGWVDECRRLRQVELSREARQALGYKEIFAWLDAPVGDFSEVVSGIQARTRQFAKRQLTWFRKLPVIPVAATESELPGRILKTWESLRAENNLTL